MTETVAFDDVSLQGAAVGGVPAMRRCVHNGRSYLFRSVGDVGINQAALLRLLAWRQELPPQARAALDGVARWPMYAVRDRDGVLRGVLLPAVPAALNRPTRLRHRPVPRTIAALPGYPGGRAIFSPAGRIAVQRQVAERLGVRRRALGRVAEAVLTLHAHGVLVNEIRADRILCAADGDTVSFVDTETMTGPWGQVRPPAVPDRLRVVVPDAGEPSRTVDLAQLAWLTMWTLLDDDTVSRVSAAALAGLVGDEHAELLVHSGRARRAQPAPSEAWRRLARDWTRVPASVGGSARAVPDGSDPPRSDPPVSDPPVSDPPRAVPPRSVPRSRPPALFRVSEPRRLRLRNDRRGAPTPWPGPRPRRPDFELDVPVSSARRAVPPVPPGAGAPTERGEMTRRQAVCLSAAAGGLIACAVLLDLLLELLR